MLAVTGPPTPRSDFPVYWLAGKAVLEGRDIYGIAGPHGWQYIYPPPFALAMVPFALLPLAWAMLAWFLLSALVTVRAVQMCVTMARDRLSSEEDLPWLSAVPILLLIGFYVSAITRGQASVLTLWLVVAAIFWEGKGRDVAGASCLAGAILIKVFPAFLLAYFAWRRRWRFVLATLALLFMLAMAAAMWAVGRRASSRDGLFLSSTAVVWALLAPPVSWSHYFILLLLPLTALVALARGREDAVARRAAWVALTVFGVASIASVVLKGSLEKYGIPCWAALVVWSVLLLAVKRCPPPGMGSPGRATATVVPPV